MTTAASPQAPRAPMRELPYEPLVEGENYWVVDDVLPDAHAVRERMLRKQGWELGAPYAKQTWPGMRTRPCLEPDELEHVEARVRELTGADRLWVARPSGGGHLNHNCVQVVGAREGGVKPHTDARSLCTFAAVVYLLPDAPRWAGTGFYRQRMPDGRLGGNIVQAPHDTMVDALGTRFVPAGSFVEDLRLDNVFNRMLMYKANLVHSASAYCGSHPAQRRMTNVLFWRAGDGGPHHHDET